MNYEFQTMLYRNAREMCLAVAREWLSAGGGNSRADMLKILSDMSDAEMADEAIEGWGLDQVSQKRRFDESEPQNWMQERGIYRQNIIDAFQWVRANVVIGDDKEDKTMTDTNEIDVVLRNDISGLFPEMTLFFQNGGVHIRFNSADKSDPREYFLAVEGDGSDEDAARKISFARQDPEAFCLRYADAMRNLIAASRVV